MKKRTALNLMIEPNEVKLTYVDCSSYHSQCCLESSETGCWQENREWRSSECSETLSAYFYLTPKKNQHPTMLQAEQTDIQLATGFMQSEPGSKILP